MSKNRHRLNTLKQTSVFGSNLDSDPMHKLRLENTKLLEKINQANENNDILMNKIEDLNSQNAKVDGLLKEKSNRITAMQEEQEHNRLLIQK
jgi:hypothetical protein